MSIEISNDDVIEALLDQVRDLSQRLAHTTAAVQQLQREGRQQLDTIAHLHEQLSPLQPPTPAL